MLGCVGLGRRRARLRRGRGRRWLWSVFDRRGCTCSRQAFAALTAEFVVGRVGEFARGADSLQSSPAFAAELHPGGVLVLAARALHLCGSGGRSRHLRGDEKSSVIVRIAPNIPAIRYDKAV